MPVDFLPRELLHRDHVEKGTESVPLTTEVLSEATTKVPKFDADVIPLKVRKVGANFAHENGAFVMRRHREQCVRPTCVGCTDC